MVKNIASQILALSGPVSVSPPVAPGTLSPSIVFNQSFGEGAIHEDIRHLQQFLNNNGFRLSESGPGSPGKETNIFGPLTKQALINFQEANAGQILEPLGLTKGTGYFGPSTRAFINSLK